MTVSSVEWTAEGIRGLRKRMELTQQAFADVLGTTRQTIIHWENGHQTPKKMACHLLSALEEKMERGAWREGDVSQEVAALDPRLTQMVLQSENPEATARTLLRIARMHRSTS
jgi:DNA-binding XRE family transcriptional regulator